MKLTIVAGGGISASAVLLEPQQSRGRNQRRNYASDDDVSYHLFHWICLIVNLTGWMDRKTQ
jgi:hypothetical protein